MHVTVDFSPATWAEAARPVLIEAAGRYRALVKYKQLEAALQESTGATAPQPLHRWLADVLARVAQDCESRGEPLLSSLCVNIQGSAGQAYADAVAAARGARPDDPDEHAAVERLECYRHWQAAGLPSDGGTPLRTAHFTPARKAPARKAPARASATRVPGTARTPAAPRKRAAATPAAPEPKPVAMCPTCFTAVPASGICDYCD